MENQWHLVIIAGPKTFVLGPHASKSMAESEKLKIETQTYKYFGNQGFLILVLDDEHFSKFVKEGKRKVK